MAESKTLQELFVDELKDAYDAEKQLIKALRKMSRAATNADLSAAFAEHLEETNGQVAILENVFAMLELKPRGKHCPGIAGIIEEGGEAIEAIEKSPVLDSALVGGGRRAEHYEIAAYTTLIAMAKQLGRQDAAGRFSEILAQEVACDKKLDALGQMLLPMAGNQSEGDDDNGDASSRGRSGGKRAAPAKKTTARKAAKKGAKKGAAKRGR